MRFHCLLCLLFVGTFSLLADNLLINPEFKRDSLGNIINWNLGAGKVARKITAKTINMDGGHAVSLEAEKEPFGFRQEFITLIPGEKYRISVWVQTKNFSSRDFRFILYDHGWVQECGIHSCPKDTKGKWQKLETVVTLPSQAKYPFSFSIYNGKGATGTCLFRNPCLEPVSQKAVKESKPALSEDVKLNRLVPLSTRLSAFPSENGVLEFYYAPVLSGDKKDYEFQTEVISVKDGKTIFAQKSSFPAKGNLKISFGHLPLGPARLQISLKEKNSGKILVSNTYRLDVKARIDAQGKELNNLVTERLSVPVGKGKHSFSIPREGWVYITVSGTGEKTLVFLDQNNQPILRHRPGEPFDTMRYLEAGKHELRIENASPDACLNVRSVPIILFTPSWPKDGEGADDPVSMSYSYATHTKKMLHNVNTLHFDMWKPQSAKDKRIDADLAERGHALLGTMPFPRNAWSNAKRLEGETRNYYNVRLYQGTTWDELDSAFDLASLIGVTEATWNLQDIASKIYVWSADFSNYYNKPEIHNAVFTGVANMGNGRGMLMLETYAATGYGEKSREIMGGHMRNLLKSLKKISPDAPESVMFVTGGYTTPGNWCQDSYPPINFKAYSDWYFHLLATDPEFKGIAGTGIYSIKHFDEEYLRWTLALIRHYCIEGKTESLAARHGFPFFSRLLVNGDFEKGFESWTAKAAEEGSLEAETIDGLGSPTGHFRRDRIGNFGDTCAMFIRSPKAPNQLSQTVKNLVPGRLYVLRFWSCDPDDFRKHSGKHIPFLLDVEVDGGIVIPELSYVRRNIYWKFENCLHRVVFRAEKKEGKITFRDWKSDSEAGRPAGEKRILNGVSLHPYFEK